MSVDNFESALELSRSDNSHERLVAARYFMTNASSDHDAELKSWLARETVGWVKNAIDIALTKNTQKQALLDPPDTTEVENKTVSYTLALREVASIMLHELEPRIGILGVKLKDDIPNYEDSASRRQMDHLKDFFKALSFLRLATEVTGSDSFTCSDWISGLIEGHPYAKNIRLIGPQGLIVRADQGLLKLALSNGIKNAVESTAAASQTRSTEDIIINWGETNVDYWIAVIDDGSGLGKPTEKLIRIGTTTKPGHFGMGLTIAQQAMQSLNGKLSLHSPAPIGAVFELRWYK
ncbi:ATP-binding protein [Pseudomonas sp. 2,4-D]|uniref:ATP-binding protein n=1 Tax=Pseudomonas sp. 2,4-D TaxID=3058433 RepID=UPI002633E43C|nr:ATP-binding protein [Pseudomonas sp. 2,4-D]MDN4514675.1 ATP-binding protein [Pseudomonas sp. 2,4-D]